MRFLSLSFALIFSVQCAFGEALKFDGTDDAMLTENNDILDGYYDAGNGNFTMSHWIKTADTSEAVTFSSEGWYFFRINNSGATNKIQVDFTGGSIPSTSTSDINDDAWHLVVGVFDGTNQHLYIDGVREDFDAVTLGNITSTNRKTSIGSNWNNGLSADVIAEDCRIYARALSADEIRTLHEMAQLSKYAQVAQDDLVGWWPMDDFRDGVTASGTNAIRDYSEQGNHGTPQNSPVGAEGNLGHETVDATGTTYDSVRY